MRVLFAADEYPYSQDAIRQVERLGRNTWADITILGIAQTPRINRTLETLEKDFCHSVGSTAVAYGHLPHSGTGRSPIQKQIRTCIRNGHPAAEILKEARQMGSDLIVIGGAEHSLNWQDDGNVPLKVARNADCSVLAIKEDKRIEKIICCLDHTNVTQASLDMINQMVTLFDADLEIAVLSHGRHPGKEIEDTLSDLFTHYTDLGIYPRFQMVKAANFVPFFSRQSKWGLVALWMGKKSILHSVFPDRKAARLLKLDAPSILFLK